jgi:hypothetical protein
MISNQQKKWIVALGVLAAMPIAGCGNYSNEDLDFQLALPEQSDVEVKMQSTLRLDSADYYVVTRNAVTTFNTAALNMVALIEVVRGYTPTERHGNQRIWGPFPNDAYPALWEGRVVMERSTVSESLLHMEYAVQVRQVGQGGSAWTNLLTGAYTSQGSARTGVGEIHLLAATARAALYPVDDDPGLRELDHVDVTYSNASYPIEVTMSIVNVAAASTKSGTYTYQQEQDGSGMMEFAWKGTSDAGLTVAADMTARWLGSGAGRADLVLEPDGLDATLGTDCWGVDTTATYSFRIRDDATNRARNDGSVDSCLFPN